MVLKGTEVKSLRDRHCQLDQAYVSREDGELWLINCEIAEYSKGNLMNHAPKRKRKLLVHRREIEKFAGKAEQRGFTMVPTKVYFRNSRAKVEIAVARGKQTVDKRQSIKERDVKKEISRAARSHS